MEPSEENVTPTAEETSTRPQRSRLKRGLTALTVVALLSGGGFYYYFQQTLLPHYHVVREGVLYRSGQPRGIGLNWIRHEGIRTIVNLRHANSRGNAEEEAFSKANNIRFVNIPVGDEGFDLRKSTDLFLEIAGDSSNWPILVHCSRGKERAGLMSAVYRIRYDGWKPADAEREAERYGLDPNHLPTVADFILKFDEKEPGAGDANGTLTESETWHE